MGRFLGDLPGPDVLRQLHGLTGRAFVLKYLGALHPRISRTVLPYAELFDNPESEWDLFKRYRRDRGYDVAGFWQPDTWEVEGRAAFHAAADRQTRFHLKRGAVPRLVADSLDQMSHIEAALGIEHTPMDSPAPLALSTRFAIDMCVAFGSDVATKRQNVLRHFRCRAKRR